MAAHDPTLLFLHIPKAGGITLNSILEHQFRRDRIYHVPAQNPPLGVAQFAALSEAQRSHYRLVTGHVLYGLHRYIPRPATYLTFLRDPVERVISQFYFARSNPEHYLYAHTNEPGMDLMGYATRQVSREISNQQVSMLAGVPVSRQERPPDRNMLEAAKEHLSSHFSVVGLMEEFDTGLLLMQRAFGWKIPPYLRENVTRGKPSTRQVDARARELLAELNALDIELYAFAKQLFDAQCAAYGSSLKRDLARYQAYNARYQRIVGPLRQTRKRLAVRLQNRESPER